MPEAEDVQTLDPVDDWSQVDPDYEHIPAGDDGQDDAVEDPEELDEDLTEEEIEVPDDLSELLPFWVSYELHGRNLDAETAWERLAVEDFDGELEVEVDGLTAGARWEFRVRLIDRDGRHSRFSDALVIDLPTDFTPPPAPTEPIVRNVRGYTAVGWDGLLQGPIPGDMSHVQLYVQQEHPEGDPDGEPGDPRRITTMSTAGEHPLLQFLANVLHKAWFTAVDTTGNESPWSPQVEFTPEPPVDTDAIEAELEDARDRLAQAEQDLASGMADRVAEIEYLRETRIPELQQALDNIQPVIDDYDDRIQSAQDGAQSARSTAENLRDNVLPPLQGEIVDLTENRLPAAEHTLDETRLGMENLRDVALPDLDQELRAGIQNVGASVESLQIGNWDNLFADPNFQLIGSDGSLPADGSWFYQSGARNWRNYTTGNSGSALFNNTEGVSSAIFHRPHGKGIAVKPGEQYEMLLRVQRPAGSTGLTPISWVFWRRDGSSTLVRAATPSSGINEYTHTVTVPDDTAIEYMGWTFSYASSASGYARILDVNVRAKVPGRLIVDGSIEARHIMAESVAGAVAEFLQLTAENIDTEGLAAYLATIIQLDAGQITSGKISTSRLDAEEVAGEVANFLALDALEINVEELAGQIANIIEVTAESIAAGAISTRHLAIADFENLMPQQAIEDLAANGDNTEPWTRVRGNTDRWYTVTGQGRGMRSIRINDGTTSHARTTLEYAPGGGLGVPLSPGDSLRLTFYGWAGGTGAAPVISLLVRDAGGSFVGRADSASAQSGWHEYALEIHNDDELLRYLRVEFDVPAGVAMRGHWQDFKLRRMENGELLVDGAVKSRSVDTEEFFSARAVIDKIWTDIVYSELVQSQGIITEDMIATGAITTPKLTVTEEMVGEVAKLLRIEAGSLASNDIEAMRIVSSLIEATTYLIHNADGDVSVRLDGMDNYLAGRLHAGMTETEGIVLDWGEKVRYSGLTDEGDPAPVRTITTPYFNFHTDNTDYEPGAEPSIYLERDSATGERDGMMIINPGYPTGTDAFRGTLNVVGDALANRFTPRERLQINTSHSDQPGVIQSSGQGLRIRGQIPSSSHSQEMFYVGQTDLATLAAGGRRKRTLSWGVPVPRGRRDPIGTVYLQGASSNNNARVEMNISQRTTTSYRLDEYNNSSVDAGYWVGIIAPWRNV